MKATATVLLCFVVAGALAAVPRKNQKIIDSLEKCFNKNEIDEKNVQNLPEIKESCSNSCILKTLEIMNLDGTLNWDNILNEHPTMSDEKFESFIKTCTDELSGQTFVEDEYTCVFVHCLLRHDFFLYL